MPVMAGALLRLSPRVPVSSCGVLGRPETVALTLNTPKQ